MTGPSFNDPKPPSDRRQMQQIFLRPSIKAEIDQRRGNLTRSVWIERAVLAAIARENDRTPRVTIPTTQLPNPGKRLTVFYEDPHDGLGPRILGFAASQDAAELLARSYAQLHFQEDHRVWTVDAYTEPGP